MKLHKFLVTAVILLSSVSVAFAQANPPGPRGGQGQGTGMGRGNPPGPQGGPGRGAGMGLGNPPGPQGGPGQIPWAHAGSDGSVVEGEVSSSEGEEGLPPKFRRPPPPPPPEGFDSGEVEGG